MSPQEETTVERIRTAAVELFAERGYGGASMAGIAERVGIQKASLYNYYSSKGELLLELVERAVDRWGEACCDLGDRRQGAAGERLRNHLRAVRSFAVAERDTLALIHLAALQVGGELGERARALHQQQKDRYREQMSGFFESAMANGEVRAGDPETVTLAWGSFVQGMLMRLIHCPSADDPYEGRLDEVWRVFWQGLEPLPRGER